MQAASDLAKDDTGAEVRREACSAYAGALAEVGQLLWITGSMLGPDRADGKSPFGFGSDDVVGLSVVCQVGGELARGFLDLFESGNLYSAQALLRQIVEVEYLMAAFADQDAVAAEWLRATRKERLKFWSPARLREKAKGKFLREDYWLHCDLGGHPTPDARALLPNHKTMEPALVSTDFAGHMFSTWTSLVKAIKVRRDQLPDEIEVPIAEVEETTAAWLEADDLTAVVRAIHLVHQRPHGRP
ncbi:MAG: hypothetical protein U0R24_15310 [Solirubrobacterales bacterium]